MLATIERRRERRRGPRGPLAAELPDEYVALLDRLEPAASRSRFGHVATSAMQGEGGTWTSELANLATRNARGALLGILHSLPVRLLL